MAKLFDQQSFANFNGFWESGIFHTVWMNLEPPLITSPYVADKYALYFPSVPSAGCISSRLMLVNPVIADIESYLKMYALLESAVYYLYRAGPVFGLQNL